jgi:hypothetical protein
MIKGEGPVLQRLVNEWLKVSSKVVYMSAPVHNVLSQSVPACQVFYKHFCEILSAGGKQWMNACSQSCTILRTVEFGVDIETITTWCLHVLDAMCYHERLKVGVIPTFQNLVGEQRGSVKEGVLVSELYSLRATMSKYSFSMPNSITISLKKKTRRGKRNVMVEVSEDLDLCLDTTLGITHDTFIPLDEDGLDEFEYGWEYEDDFEDLTFDEDAEIPKLAYVYLHMIDKYTLRKVRGTAWNLVIAFRVLGENVREIADKITYYKSCTHEDLFFAWTGKAGKIEGATKLTWEQMGIITGKGGYTSPSFCIDGKIITKLTAWSTPAYRNSLTNMDSYFIQMRTSTENKEVEKMKKVVNVIETSYALDPEFKENKRVLENLLEKEGIRERKDIDLEPVDEHGLTDLLSKLGGILDNLATELTGGGDESGLLKMFDPKLQYHFKEPTSLLSDEHLLGELEAILPEYWGMIMNKEIALSKSQKLDRLDLAAMKISRMTGTDKETYTALYRIIQFIFTLIPERGGVTHLSNSFMLHIDGLFSRGDRVEHTEGLYPLHMLIPGEPFDMPDDMSFLE